MRHLLIVSLAATTMALQAHAFACPENCKCKGTKANAPHPCGSNLTTDGKTTAIVVSTRAHDQGSEDAPAPGGKSKSAPSKESKSCCNKKGKSSGVAGKIDAVLTSLPAIQYRVNGEDTTCSESAASMAQRSGKPIEFMVDGDVFDTEGKAKVRLLARLDEEIESMQSIQFVAGGKCHACPMTAKDVAKSSKTKVTYRAGGVDFDTKKDAQQAIEAITKAVENVSMTYKVDGHTYGCDKMAGAKRKETGKQTTYVVGDTETSCEVTAKLHLAEQRIRKIVETAATMFQSLSS